MAEESEIAKSYRELWEDLFLEADASACPQQEAFFSLYARMAAECGECSDLNYTPVKKDGRGGYQVDGYSLEHETGELYLALCDFRPSSDLETLNVAQIEALVQRVKSFLDLAIKPDFIQALEETSPAFEAAYPVYSNLRVIRRIRILIFSNARLATRRPPEAIDQIVGLPAVFSVLDFTRYDAMRRSLGQVEPIELDVTELNGSPLPCLKTQSDTGDYEAYLVAMPGPLLATIYSLYGPRLLEQNVRTFLQAKTKVNRGIIETITSAPGRFFAYNNGITATASGLGTTRLSDGSLGIASIRNLQIVNGGQTTASVLYAKDRSGADLQRVLIPMKLSVVSPGQIEEMVPKISRYANTQNKINEADFFSSHPFHIALEQISRRLIAPPKPGFLSGSKWFYERARGQYKDQLAYGAPAARNKFEHEYPKDQKIDKTELGKYELTFLCQPNVVSLGEQKCFVEFAELVGKEWDQNPASFDDDWFKRAVAKALIFRWTDRMVAGSEWYKSDRGFKAQIVTYTIAWLVSYLAKVRKSEIAYDMIWGAQTISDELDRTLQQIARQIAKAIKQTPPNVKNVGEYCKQEACWSAIQKTEFRVPAELGPEIRRKAGASSTPPKIDADGGGRESLVTHISQDAAGKDDLILGLRSMFNGSGARDRDDLIAALAELSGCDLNGPRTKDDMTSVIRTAVRRGILENNGDGLSVATHNISDYERDFLKVQFMASMQGGGWTERTESIRMFARWLGFRRTGPYIEEAARSIINGLIREGKLESEGSEIRRRG